MAFDPERIKLARRGLFAGGGTLALSAFLEAPAFAADTPPNPRDRVNLNAGWRFVREDHTDSVEWTLNGPSPGTFVRLQNVATGLFLDGMGRTGNGDDLGQWVDSSGSNQRWTVTAAS